MRADSAKRILNMEMRGFEVEHTESFIYVSHPEHQGVSFLLSGGSADDQVDAAWEFTEKFDGYITNAPACHHIKKEL